MTPRLNLFLLALALIIGLPTYWLLIDNRPEDAKAKPVSIGELRSLAASKPGSAPAAIRYEAIGRVLRMGNLSAAGAGLRPVRLFAFVHMLEVPGKAPILIGSGMTRKEAKKLDFSIYDSKAQARVTSALGKASFVIPLDRRPAQMGGAKALASDITGRNILSSIENLDEADAAGRPHALAPGVVLIPTPGRRPGSRLVYVRLADGREYLFVGGLARTKQAWRELRAPARLITDYREKEDRQEIYSWLLTVRTLKQEAPGLVIVPGSKIPKDSGLERYFPGHGAK